MKIGANAAAKFAITDGVTLSLPQQRQPGLD
jgi:hypothetical protein